MLSEKRWKVLYPRCIPPVSWIPISLIGSKYNSSRIGHVPLAGQAHGSGSLCVGFTVDTSSLMNTNQPTQNPPPTHIAKFYLLFLVALLGNVFRVASRITPPSIFHMLNFCLNSLPAQRRNWSEILVRAISVWHLRSPQNKEWSQVIPAQGSSLPCHWWSLAQAGGPSWPSGAIIGPQIARKLEDALFLCWCCGLQRLLCRAESNDRATFRWFGKLLKRCWSIQIPLVSQAWGLSREISISEAFSVQERFPNRSDSKQLAGAGQ